MQKFVHIAPNEITDQPVAGIELECHQQ